MLTGRFTPRNADEEMNSRTGSEQVRQTCSSLKFYGWYSDISVAEVARRMNAAGKRTVRGCAWTESNLRAFARRHSFSRDVLQNMEHMVVTIDEPGLFEMARPDMADILSVQDGMRNARVISRYIEKGSRENKARLWRAIEDDAEVRTEVLRFAPLMLDHPWAAEDYQTFLDHARAIDAARQ